MKSDDQKFSEKYVAVFSYAHTDLVGNCSRPTDGLNSYNGGLGTDARVMSPEHGYQLKDGEWVIFVNGRSCAQGIKLSNNLKPVVNFIGM